MSETYALLLVVVSFAVLFTIGLWRSNKLFRNYANLIRDYSSPISDYVGFTRYGRGFKALCIPKKRDVFTRIDATVSLTWRENPMFYLMSPLFRDRDRLILWGELAKTPRIDIELVRRGTRSGEDRSLKEVRFDEFGITLLTDQVSEARRFLESIRYELGNSLDCLEYLRLGRDFRWVKVMGRIENGDSIRKMFDLLLRVGERASNF